jgi:phage-related protein
MWQGVPGVPIRVGQQFTILAYEDEQGVSSAKRFLDALSDQDRAKILTSFDRICSQGRIASQEHFKNEEGDIWVFKRHQIRIYCFFDKGRVLVLTHGIIKKSPKAKKTDLEKARKICREFRGRRK